MNRKEPEQLRRGKEFHKKIQSEWVRDAEGEILIEKSVTKPSGKLGRVDVLAVDGDQDVAVLEIKYSDWDRMIPTAVKRNIRRQIRQIWQYIESQLTDGKSVSPGISFPKRPQDNERMKLIEAIFWEEGIPVVWEDESIQDRKRRAKDEEKAATD